MNEQQTIDFQDKCRKFWDDQNAWCQTSLIEELFKKEFEGFDWDSVQSGNICRSQYYSYQINHFKSVTLLNALLYISPFTELSRFFINKTAPDDCENAVSEENLGILNNLDILFDCTADNELCYYLDKINPDAAVINISISNQAKEIVIICGSEISRWKKDLFEHFSPIEEDLYVGIGCWSPTFKASYNDIRMLLEYAIGIINHRLDAKRPLNSFVIRRSEENHSINMEVTEY